MADVESGLLGAATHAALAVVGVVEGKAFKSRIGKFLAGCATGWHVYAVFYHLCEHEKRRKECSQLSQL